MFSAPVLPAEVTEAREAVSGPHTDRRMRIHHFIVETEVLGPVDKSKGHRPAFKSSLAISHPTLASDRS